MPQSITRVVGLSLLFPPPCGQGREITRRWLFSPVSDEEAILLAVRVVAFRIDFSAILLRVVHSRRNCIKTLREINRRSGRRLSNRKSRGL